MKYLQRHEDTKVHKELIFNDILFVLLIAIGICAIMAKYFAFRRGFKD